MSSPPTFTIIIPALNRLDLLREAIASIKAQIYRSYELIVVDDGSTDGFPQRLTAGQPSSGYFARPPRAWGSAQRRGKICDRHLPGISGQR